MERIKVLDDALWPTVPPEVIEEAQRSARAEPHGSFAKATATSLWWKKGQAVPTPPPAT